MEVKKNPFLFLFLFLTLLLFARSSIDEEAELERSQFPDGFLFGAATSSYQVEGAYLEDGKGLSNWDFFTHIAGKIDHGDNGDVADDHYHLYLDDIELLHSLGVNAYRFSISWSRILPSVSYLIDNPLGGRFGDVNPTGIMFYNKIIDNLLLKGIKPFVTINHFEIPQELEEKYGSWLSPLIQEDFVHFVKTCFESFGDRVKYWTTINEPNLYVQMAYLWGEHPPARCSTPFGNCSAGNSDTEPLIAMHNMLLAHAKAAKLYHQKFQPIQGGFIGIVVYTMMYEPLRDDEDDHEAVNRALAFNVAWVLDPLIFGDYPSEMWHYLGSDLPSFSHEEAKDVRGSIDFIAVNHYSTLYVKDCLHSSCVSSGDRPIQGFVHSIGERDGVPIGERTGMPRFFVVPRGMKNIINYLNGRYGNWPIFVTENGYSAPVEQSEQVEDSLQDVKRIQFHKAYLSSLVQAIRGGADVRGYFIWTLMDNFEWTRGYSLRFGLYYIDRQTLNRIPKLSARWYTNFLANISSDHGGETAVKIA